MIDIVVAPVRGGCDCVASASEDGWTPCGYVHGVTGCVMGEVAPLIGTIGH